MLTDKQKHYLPIKRTIDIVLSGGAIVVLSPVLGLLALAIKLDSPGPVLFKQKRVGKDKELFEIYKFRTMRTDTPSDMPTHMLKDPDQFITKTGKFLRKTSLDELPQILNIFTGEMSIIGPRPALWNQDDLISERDKYHANDVTPGLTGWAQINGRDELEIDVKAKFDGDYVKDMSLLMDVKCFLATIGSVLLHDGVVEGGTGEMEQGGMEAETVDPEKIEREVKLGAAVVTAAGVVGLTGLGLVCKHIKNKDSKKDNKAHKGLIFDLLALGFATYTILKNTELKNRNEVDKMKSDKNIDIGEINNDGKFSVLISIYKNDNPEFLKSALTSIYENQSLKPNEIVIVFDGPLTGDLYRIVDSFCAGKEEIVKVIKLEKNGGLGNALKIGSKYCSHEYIFRMDSDDISDVSRFEKQMKYMESHLDIDVLGTDIAEFNDTINENMRVRQCPENYNEIVKMAKKRNPMNHVTVCMRKEALKKCGGYETLLLLEDYYLWLKMIVSGCKLANINESLVYVRVGNGFNTKRSSNERIIGWKVLQQYMIDNNLINKLDYITNMIFINAFVRTPSKLKSKLYSTFLRK